ncbi:MAG: radical SAM family heme chaperone HemW, partial [Gammaproteobacteria bacterium]
RGSLDESAYLDALLQDAGATLSDLPPGSIDTVFLGGGTPSLFAPASFERLLRTLRPWLAVDVEITLEANPGTIEHHDPAGYLAAGINRLSFGAQSFDDVQLRRLGRIHSAAETAAAVHRARAAGARRINLDVMYALPRQAVRAATADVDAALALEPDHISWYQLTLEPKTTFAARPPRLPGGSAIVRMEAAGAARLRAAGFSRYEVSAWARPGQACRHNVNYWTFGDYIGIGAGAHGKRSRQTSGPDEAASPVAASAVADSAVAASGVAASSVAWRTAKASQPRVYLAAPTTTQTAPILASALPLEFLMNALRLIEGVPFERFTATTGLPRQALEPGWSRGVDQGLLRSDRIATTETGLRYLDDVLAGFL